MLCSYGCGNKAVKKFKSGKFCCHETTSSCPAMKEKNSQKIKEIRKIKGNTFWKNGHPKGSKNGTSLKGKSYEEIYGYEESAKRKKHLSKINSGVSTWNKLSTAEKTQVRKKCSDAINKRYAAGWLPKAGRCKKYKYTSPVAGEVSLDGTWELTTAKWLDMNNYVWKRNTTRFPYINLKGKKSYYTPDFYVEGIGYIEVKGYKTKLDECKWSQFDETLTVWFKDKIEQFKTDLESKLGGA